MNAFTDKKRKLIPENNHKAQEVKLFKSEVIPKHKKQDSKVFSGKNSSLYFSAPQSGCGLSSTSGAPKRRKRRNRRKRNPENRPDIKWFKSEVIPKQGKQDIKVENSSPYFPTPQNGASTATGGASAQRYKRKHRRYWQFKRKSDKIKGCCRLISRQFFQVDVVESKELVDIFASMPGGYIDFSTNKWTFSIDDHGKLFTLLVPLQHRISILPLPWYVLEVFQWSQERKPNVDYNYDLSRMDQGLVNALLPFQKIGLYFGIQHRGKILLADDMGLGKTIQAIAIANYFKEDWPLLIVSPSSVKYSWLEAFEKWLPSLDATEINVVDSGRDKIAGHSVVIMSYDLLKKFETDITNRGFKSVIFDESHYLKSGDSLRTKVAQTIMKNMKRIIMLSGTPALSRPIELYTQLSALCPQYFNSYRDYGSRYCSGRRTNWRFKFSGSSNTEELKLLLEELVMIRRMKSEVISQLPSKRRQVILLESSQLDFAAKRKYLSPDVPNSEMKKSELIHYFYRTGFIKTPAVCQYVLNLLELGKKFLCFAHHYHVIDSICSFIENKKVDYIRIDGAVSAERRKELCDHFQTSDTCKVAVLSVTAACCGITLTAADLVVFAELYWNPGTLTQAEDRAHRIGQENSVLVQYLIARRTADDIIWPMIKRKLVTLNKVGLSNENFALTDRILMNNFHHLMSDDALADLEVVEFQDYDIAETVVKMEV